MAGNEMDTRRDTERFLRPACVVCEESEGRIVMQLEMPGVSQDSLELHYEDNTLQITGRRRPEAGEETYLVRERHPGTFYQAYTLDNTIDPGTIEASLADGVLTVNLDRKAEEKPRKITVKSG